jgi:hypothetical protein
VSGQHSARRAERAGKLQHEITNLAAYWRATVDIIRFQVTRRHARRQQLLANVLNDSRLFAATTRNGHQLGDELESLGIGYGTCP